MSGGSGSGSSGGFSPLGGGEPDVSCRDLRFNTRLHSVSPDGHVTAGDVYEVRIDGEEIRIVVVADDGHVVGALATQISRLLECIRSGTEYEAEVLDADGGDIRVEVRAA